MPLSPEQRQELEELRRLDQLEAKFGAKYNQQVQPPQAQVPQSPINTASGAFGRTAVPSVQPTQQGIQSNMNAMPGKLASSYNKFTGSHPGETALESGKRGISTLQNANSAQDLSPDLQMAFESGQGDAAKASGEALGKAVAYVGKAVSKGGDMLMQKAAGLKRYIPGVGQTLADEGVVGTKGMMRGQVENALKSRGQEIGELSKNIQEVSTRPVAERLGERAAKLVGPDGEVLPDNIKAYHKFIDEATQASQQNSVSGEIAASRRSQYGKIAKDAGRYRDNPAQGLKSQLAGEQQAGYSQALKSAPGASPELAAADKAYGNLATADKAMATPESLSNVNMLSNMVPSSLAESVLGRGLLSVGSKTQAMQKPANYGLIGLRELLGRK